MADDKSGTNLASGSVIVAALAAMGAYYLHREAPLLDSRPAVTEASVEPQVRVQEQTTDARLWQDPFAAVAKALDKEGKKDPEQRCQGKASGENPCKSPLKSSDKGALILGVMVSGAPYPEDAEQRRRTRYSVLAGLERAGFVPKDARHIGYFWLAQNPRPSTALQMPSLALWQFYQQRWSRDQPTATATTIQLSPLMWSPLLQLYQQWQDHNSPAVDATTAQLPPLLILARRLQLYQQWADLNELTAIMPEIIVPYEWFEQPPQKTIESTNTNETHKRILVLWLEEESLKNHPLQTISELKYFINLQNDNKIKFIGPYTSDILRDMVNEVCPFVKIHEKTCGTISKLGNQPGLKDVQFYAYGASVPDKQLLGDLIDPDKADQNVFKDKLNIDLQRTLANDDTLAQGIVNEIAQRNIKVGPHSEDKGGDVALISEWDTFYGQTFPNAVEAKFDEYSGGKCDDGTVCWVHKFTYLRGLDGLLPMTEGAEDRKQDKSATQAGKQPGVANLFQTQPDAKNLDRPVGQGQFDYLRRMSKDLHKTDEELRKKKRKLKVIGVLGSDVFDKLLVLRALRPEFPDALFFTTDFDEAYTIESELPYTRNLLISSSFGPKLNDEIQKEIPSFRSTYQTSAFLATLSAIGDPDDNWKTPEGFPDYIAGQISAPRIFEISRSGDILALSFDSMTTPSPVYYHGEQKKCLRESGSCNPLLLVAEASIGVGRSAAGKAQGSNEELPSCAGGNASNCGNIQPVNQPLFPTFDDAGRKLLSEGLAIGALLLALLYLWRIVPESAHVEVWIAVICLDLAALACAAWEPFAQFLTDHGRGEPVAMLEGVSVWPTVLLRISSIVLSIYFIWRAQDGLFKNLEKISWNMELNPKPAPFDVRIMWKKIGIVARHKRFLWKNIRGIFDFSLGRYPGTRNSHFRVEHSWRAYVLQEQFWSRRFWRASLYTLLMFGFFNLILVPMLGSPAIPARSNLAHYSYLVTTYIDVILMLFLTFFVFDATLFCLLFVNKLRRTKTQWPEKTVKAFDERVRLQPEIVHDWIDLEFVAKRTRCIGLLIYYPFVLIALLIVSRSSVFANYSPSPTILVALGMSLSIVFGCAIMLWWAATSVRDTAKQNLTDKIIWAKGPCTVFHSSSGATTHHDSDKGKHDVGKPPNLLGHAHQLCDTATGPSSQQKDSGDNPRYAEQLETMLSRVDQLRDGAFGPFTQQPLVRAVLLPLGSFGWTALIENGMLPGL